MVVGLHSSFSPFADLLTWRACMSGSDGPSAEEWMEDGDRSMTTKDFIRAIHAYTQHISTCRKYSLMYSHQSSNPQHRVLARFELTKALLKRVQATLLLLEASEYSGIKFESVTYDDASKDLDEAEDCLSATENRSISLVGDWDEILVEIHCLRAEIFLKKKIYGRALSLINHVVQNNPYQCSARLIRGIVFLQMPYNEKCLNVAIEDFSFCRNLDFNPSKALYFRGLAYMKIGEKAKAMEDFCNVTAGKTEPWYSEAIKLIGVHKHRVKRKIKFESVTERSEIPGQSFHIILDSDADVCMENLSPGEILLRSRNECANRAQYKENSKKRRKMDYFDDAICSVRSFH